MDTGRFRSHIYANRSMLRLIQPHKTKWVHLSFFYLSLFSLVKM